MSTMCGAAWLQLWLPNFYVICTARISVICVDANRRSFGSILYAVWDGLMQLL
jgi:hypothetical protein